MRAAVRGLLEERLDRINANASRAATYLARAGLRGSEVATMEQLLCARADVLVMCARREGCSCGRGLESGFVSTIHSHRGMSGLSTRVNERGGVWSYVEKPGWDLRAASRVPMSGRAGELARRHPRALFVTRPARKEWISKREVRRVAKVSSNPVIELVITH